jgi:uncharacterized repeat protein (TIGR01451 family)
MKLLCLAAAALALGAPASAGAQTAAWSIQSLATPTNFIPGDESGRATYQVFVTNNGGKASNQSSITITDTLPAGLKVSKVALSVPRPAQDVTKAAGCKTEPGPDPEGEQVSCVITNAIAPALEPARFEPGDSMLLEINVKVPASATGTLVNRVEVEGGGAQTAVAEAENEASAKDAPAGFEEFKAELTDANGEAASAAASHPYLYSTSFGVNLVPAPPGQDPPFLPAEGDLKEIAVALPPGLAGNPMAVGRCSAQDFTNHHTTFSMVRNNFVTSNECPLSSVVGVAVIEQLEGASFVNTAPIYNLEPPKGMPGQLGFEVSGGPVYLNARIRSEGDYGATAFLHNVTEAKRVTAARIMIWGSPWDSSHDRMRGECTQSWEVCEIEAGGPPARPLLRVPSSCANPLLTTMSFTTWALPTTGASAPFSEAARVGCSEPPFDPTIESRPTTNVADSPAGLHFKLHLPQAQHEDPKALGEADLRDARVVLPPGLVANPAQADGLAACSPAQVGLTTPPGQSSPIHFNTAPAQCPSAAKLGTVSAKVPALDHPLNGAVFLATQEDNPFNSLIAIYIVFEDPQTGVVVKLAAKVSPDPVTGQLTTTVSENPQVPFEDFSFDFFEGARAPLRTPMGCGTHTTNTELTPWSAPEGQSAFPSDSFQITAGPAGPCPSGAVAPKLAAGLANPTAGTYSAFSLRLTRADGTDEFAGLSVTPPLGFAAKLAGIPYCPQAAIDQALSRSRPGQGALEAAQPSCPAASQIGILSGGAGAGPTPFYVPGKVYLAGPYKGAPLSLVAIVPALAGPFDLGVVTTRVASYIDPETAQVKAVADPLPRILAGVPVDIRDLRVNLDRPNFALAPTSCEPKSVGASVLGVSGSAASVSERFQVGGCGDLRFDPRLSLSLKGGTRRNSHPALKAVLTYPKGAGYSNVARAAVALPHSEFLDTTHIKTICTRVQFAADACPAASIYGKARAILPILDQPLEGPVYLRSSSNPLPDLVIALDGQIDADLVGRIDSHNGGTRATFDSVPDAPVTKFTLEMQGGKKGLLVNSRDICKHTNRATATFTAHNGATKKFRPALKASCNGKGKPGKGKRGR